MSTPVTFTVDMGPIISALIPIAVSMLAAAGSAALGFFAQKMHLQVSAQQVARWDDSLEKALNFGGMQAQAMIKAQGYDHIEVQSAIVAKALIYMVQKFPDALKSQGFSANLADPANATKIEEALLRALPSAMTKFAASPATPNGPK
jgi:uncharacterized membrane protein